MKKFFLVILFAVAFSVYAKTSFNSLDLNNDNELLFTVRNDLQNTVSYESLFYSEIEDGGAKTTPELLSCYPESIEMIKNGKVLQIRNRFGRAEYSDETTFFNWKERTDGITSKFLNIENISISPDGNWECKIIQDSLFSGALIILNINSGKIIELSSNINIQNGSLPVKWSEDSSILLYEKNENIYFCNPDALARNVEVDEKYRKIGRGTINSVDWASQKYLAYIDDYILYKINIKELYSLGLYSEIIGKGNIIGRLPVRFNAKTDRFSADSNVLSIVMIQNEHLFSYLKTKSVNFEYLDMVYSKPYADSSASLLNSFVFWDSSNNPYIWQTKLPYNDKNQKSSIYKISTTLTPILEIEDSSLPSFCPDKSKLAFVSKSTVFIYNINSWQKVSSLEGENIVSLAWKDNNSMFVGGDKTIKKWDLTKATYEVIMLSSVSNSYWDKSSNKIIAENGVDSFYNYDKLKHTWQKIIVENNFQKQIQNGYYRVFNGTTQNVLFENALYIRTLFGDAVTKPLYKESVAKAPAPKKVAIVFDAYDNADGLPVILSVLKKYNLKATFFINGEFIKRYPSETYQIVVNGHECASMFFSTATITDDSFIIDGDFIRRGLARNEDEFFQCTGSELSLYWHAPYYKTDSSIIEEGRNAGYEYISGNSYINTVELNSGIEPQEIITKYFNNLDKMKSTVFPITIGYAGENKINPLYDYLNLIIKTLLDKNCDIETITGLKSK
ncbi:MAG: polysaccharide deacetylase family protein [Treponema sp.]|jgi:hypothetical protein|nr:polysaccharide deacetylase family protein [Treponema sp.]